MKDLTQDAWIADRDNARDIFPKRSTSKIENRVISAAERNADPVETERRYQEVLAHNAAVRKAEETTTEKMGKITAGMPGLPGGMKFPF